MATGGALATALSLNSLVKVTSNPLHTNKYFLAFVLEFESFHWEAGTSGSCCRCELHKHSDDENAVSKEPFLE